MPNYIYALLCPSGKVRYIGKTNDPVKRLRRHISRAKYHETKSHAANWIRSLLKVGHKPTLKVLEEIPDGGDWVSREIETIAEYRSLGFDLTNATAGGEGVCGLSDESLAKRVAAAAITKSMPENRERYSRRLKEVSNTPEAKALRSELSKALWNRPGYREKRSEEFIGSARQEKMLASMTDDVRKRQGRTFSAKYKDPEFRKKMSAALSEVNSRPEVKESKRRKMAAIWQDPEYAENQKWLRVAKAMALSVKLSDPAEQARRAAAKAARAARDALKARERRAQRKAAKLAESNS